MWFLVACGAAPPPADPARGTCPQADERASDCPWAGLAREAAGSPDPAAVLERDPAGRGIVDQLARDAGARDVLASWGTAINFNQDPDGTFGVAPIVAPPIADALHGLARVAPRRGRIVHAGVQHTYGYLFSLLPTPYGFKRARWVEPTIERGFGLPPGTLAPRPAAGTLLGNATWLAGTIAFAREPAELAAAHSAPALVAPAVRALDAAASQRLVETVVVDGRTVELRTDFVDFPHPTPAAAALLVYSVRDGAGPAKLVTLFPIGAASRARYAGAPLGDAVPIAAQYNANVPGLTGHAPIAGSRALR